MIFVTGATGNVGRELVRALSEAGEPVRALIRRDEDRARLPAGAEGFVGDLNDAGSLAGALDRVLHRLCHDPAVAARYTPMSSLLLACLPRAPCEETHSL